MYRRICVLSVARHFAIKTSKKITFIVGNEACDLDSFVSSISLSYLLTQLSHDDEITYIPLIPIVKADLNLRTEVAFLLNHLYKEEHRSVSLTLFNKLNSIFKFSSNKLSPDFIDFNNSVNGVIDHHKDEGRYQDANPRIIQEAGSCSSLVLNYIIKSYSNNNDLKLLFDEKFIKFFLAPILIDTVNLEPKFDRVTEIDVESFNFLISSFTMEQKIAFNQTAFFELLQDAKANISHLTCSELLKKDYKEYYLNSNQIRFGISSVGWHLKGKGGWLERDSEIFLNEVDTFVKERILNFFFVLTTFDYKNEVFEGKKRGFERDMLIFGFSKNQNFELNSKFIEDKKFESQSSIDAAVNEIVSNEELNLVPIDKKFNIFNQLNLNASRKQVQPIIENILSKL
ncbi:Exopolyphosphatase [Clydaea vesicula]|uniref:Exopolyphosphatase n=1 Tax=Clydaea vesicula TaxID=447962 RepID=A0AAD5XTN5_9FUNG|nr:Exopolyphosphatase [Clydaea vesicula]